MLAVIEYDKQKHDASASLTNGLSKRIAASVRMVLLLLLLLGRRDPARRRTWLRTARLTSRRPEVSTSGTTQPPDVVLILRSKIVAAGLREVRRRATIPGVQTRSDIVAYREGRPKPTIRRGCERTEARATALTIHHQMAEMQMPMVRRMMTSSLFQRSSEAWTSWRSTRRRGSWRSAASIGLSLERAST